MNIIQQLQQKFQSCVLSPKSSLQLFLSATFDDPQLRVSVVETLRLGLCGVRASYFPILIRIFMENRAIYNLDQSFGRDLVDVIMDSVNAFDKLSAKNLIDLRTFTDADQQKELSWVVGKRMPRILSSMNSGLLTVDDLLNLIESYFDAPNLVDVVAQQLAERYAAECSRKSVYVLRIVAILPSLSSSSLSADFGATVIQDALRLPSLPMSSIISVLRAFQRMECYSAIGAVLLKYHSVISSCRHETWVGFAEAALAAKLENPSTRRAILRRSVELLPTMNMHEIRMQLLVSHLWGDEVSLGGVGDRIFRIQAIAAETTTSELIATLLTAADIPSQGTVVWGLCTILTHRVLEMPAEEQQLVIDCLATHRVQHTSLIERLSTSQYFNRHISLAICAMRFCGVFRLKTPSVLNDCAHCIVEHAVEVSYTEALSVLRAVLECGFYHRTLLQKMLLVVGAVIDSLDSRQLYVVAATIRCFELDERNLIEAIAERSILLVSELRIVTNDTPIN